MPSNDKRQRSESVTGTSEFKKAKYHGESVVEGASTTGSHSEVANASQAKDRAQTCIEAGAITMDSLDRTPPSTNINSGSVTEGPGAPPAADHETTEGPNDEEATADPRPDLPDGDLAFYCTTDVLNDTFNDGIGDFLWLQAETLSLYTKLQSLSEADFSGDFEAFRDAKDELASGLTIWRVGIEEDALETAGAQALKSTWSGAHDNYWHGVTLSRQRPEAGQPGLEIELRTSHWHGNHTYGTWWITSIGVLGDEQVAMCDCIGVDYGVSDLMATEAREPGCW